MVEQVSEAGTDKVPAWFVKLIPLHTEPGIAQVQDGWRQYGTLTVVSHNGFAYQALWQGNRRLLGWFLASALLCGVIGTLILRSITRPLGEVVKQAEAIGARRFITINGAAHAGIPQRGAGDERAVRAGAQHARRGVRAAGAAAARRPA